MRFRQPFYALIPRSYALTFAQSGLVIEATLSLSSAGFAKLDGAISGFSA